MKLARIYTEDLNRQGIMEIMNTVFSGYTLLSGTGVWNNQTENSLIIEVVLKDLETLEMNCECVRHCAACIADLNHQECCLVTFQDVTAEFVTA